MELKSRLQSQLKSSREYSEGLLASFHSPREWVHQVHPAANHALWFAGHMGVVDNFFISLLAPEKTESPADFQTQFGMGSQPSGNPGDYPPPDDVLAYMRDRRATLLAILDKMSEDDLAQMLPKGTPDFLRDRASVFEMAIWHEGLHSGQLSVARRSLGNQPLFTA